MQYLPEREKELLSLVYYCGLDLKEAGHRLGWSSSSAERHHKDALGKLRALVGERSLLGADVAVPALIASDYSLPRPTLHHGLEAAADRVCQLTAWALQHMHSIAESGTAVATGGAGGPSAGLCGLAVAVCLTTVISVAVLRVSVLPVADFSPAAKGGKGAAPAPSPARADAAAVAGGRLPDHPAPPARGELKRRLCAGTRTGMNLEGPGRNGLACLRGGYKAPSAEAKLPRAGRDLGGGSSPPFAAGRSLRQPLSLQR